MELPSSSNEDLSPKNLFPAISGTPSRPSKPAEFGLDLENTGSRALDKERDGDETPDSFESKEEPSLQLTPTTSLPPSHEPTWPRDYRAYVCLTGCFFLMFNSWGLVNAYGTYQSYYKQTLMPEHDILLYNLVGSTQSFMVLGLSFVVGRILDAGNPQRLIGFGAFFVCLGTFMLSLVNGDGSPGSGNYPLVWLTQGFTTGLGMACYFVSSSQIAATWFEKRKGFAIGIVASGASVSGLVYPVMTKFLIPEVGFNNAVRFVGVLVAVTSIVSILTCRPNPAHHYRRPKSWFALKVWIDTSAFRCASFVWMMCAICCLFMGFYAVFFNLEDWSADVGVGIKDEDLGNGDNPNAIRAFWLLSTMNAASTFGRLSSAYLCDHFGALNVHSVVTFVASLVLLILWTLTTTLESAFAFVIIFGIVSGAVIGLPPASMAYILGPSPGQQAKLGQWTGMMYTGSAAFALTGPVIAGYMIDALGNYYTVQGWSGGWLFMSAFCMSMARVYCGTKGREWVDRRLSTFSTFSTVARSPSDRSVTANREMI